MNILYNALLFYSRIRVPSSVVCNNSTLSSAYRYLPLVGLIVGAISAGVLLATSLVLPSTVAIMCAMATLMLLTGGLHEDGLADFADGFGAGRDKDMILRIMKDSHIGTYGVIALIMATFLKFTLLSSLDVNSLALAFVTAQGVSRFMPLVVIYTLNYVVRDNAKAGHNVLGLSTKNLVIGAIIGIAPIFVHGYRVALIYLVIMAVVVMVFRAYLHKKIDGYTGDTLGALILIAELMFYMTLIADTKL